MSCTQTDVPKKQKLVINPLALIKKNFNVFNNNIEDSSRKKEFLKYLKCSAQENHLIRGELYESVISTKDDEERDVSMSLATKKDIRSDGKVKRKTEQIDAAVLKVLYQSVIKDSITYCLGLIKYFVVHCDSENIVFDDKFPFIVVKFLGFLFGEEQGSVRMMLDKSNFKIYYELYDLVQNQPFRVFYRFESNLRRIIFLKNYIATNDYETSSFIKMNPLDDTCSLSESEMNLAREQSFDSQVFDSSVGLQLTEIIDPIDLTGDTRLIANKDKVVGFDPGSVEMRGSKSAMKDRTEAPPAKQNRKSKRRVSLPRRLQSIEKNKSLMTARTSVLQEGLNLTVRLTNAERRIFYNKRHIATNDYETSSYNKMNRPDVTCGVSESEIELAHERSWYPQEFDITGSSKLTETFDMIDLTEDTKLIANNDKEVGFEPGSAEMRGSKSAMKDRTEAPPAKQNRKSKKRVSLPRRLRSIEKNKSPMTARTSVTREGLDKPVQSPIVERRTSVLRDGLDTPVNSPIAVRMMMNMGWNGGALGLNGTGIMEPIKPVGNQKTYGLGHVKVIAKPKSNARPTEMQSDPLSRARPTEAQSNPLSRARPTETQSDPVSRARPTKTQSNPLTRARPTETQSDPLSWARSTKTQSDPLSRARPTEMQSDLRSRARPTEMQTEKKARKKNNKRDKRSQKRMEKMLADLKIRKEMGKRQFEAVLKEREAELDILVGIDVSKKKERQKKANGLKWSYAQVVVLHRLLDFVGNPEEDEVWFDRSYNDKETADIVRLVDHINGGGSKVIPLGWNEQLVEEIIRSAASYLVSEGFGKGDSRRLVIYKVPMQTVLFVNQDMLMTLKADTRCWNHLEVVVGNLLEIVIEFVRDVRKEEIRFQGAWLNKSRNIVNNFLRQLKEACNVDVTVPPVTEVQRIICDSYRYQPHIALEVTGEILKKYTFNSMCAKIIKKVRADLRRGDTIVID